jgi:Na+-translocating ferredoxin:NAD+ oxidoreductase RnfE subunit
MTQFVNLGEFQPGIKTSASTMLTSVKVLSLDVRFGVHSDVMKVPTFLRCFPNAERLHIMVIAVTDSCSAFTFPAYASLYVHSALIVVDCIDLSSQNHWSSLLSFFSSTVKRESSMMCDICGQL